MQLLDKKIRVEVNSHGGVVLHVDPKNRIGFTIWNTIANKWCVTRIDGMILTNAGWQTSLDNRRFDTIKEALWEAMNWDDTVTIKQLLEDGCLDPTIRNYAGVKDQMGNIEC